MNGRNKEYGGKETKEERKKKNMKIFRKLSERKK